MGTEDLDCEMELNQMRVSPRNVASWPDCAALRSEVILFLTVLPGTHFLPPFGPFLTASLNPPLFYTFYFTCTPNSAADRSAPACGGLSETFDNVSARNESMFHTK